MKRVMLVEDDPQMRGLLKTLFELEGFDGLVFYSPQEQEILDAVNNFNPDALIMDLHLRGLSGLNILRTLRTQPDRTNLRILITSGENQREQCLQAGASDFLLKPFMPDELIRWVNAG